MNKIRNKIKSGILVLSLAAITIGVVPNNVNIAYAESSNKTEEKSEVKKEREIKEEKKDDSKKTEEDKLTDDLSKIKNDIFRVNEKISSKGKTEDVIKDKKQKEELNQLYMNYNNMIKTYNNIVDHLNHKYEKSDGLQYKTKQIDYRVNETLDKDDNYNKSVAADNEQIKKYNEDIVDKYNEELTKEQIKLKEDAKTKRTKAEIEKELRKNNPNKKVSKSTLITIATFVLGAIIVVTLVNKK